MSAGRHPVPRVVASRMALGCAVAALWAARQPYTAGAATDDARVGGTVERMEAGPKALDDVGVDEKLGGQVPLNLPFLQSSGKPMQLSELVDGRRPVLLTFNYADCPMLCNLQLDGLVAGLRGLNLAPGQDFRVATVSIDPAETAAHSQRFKNKYVAAYGHANAETGWSFLTGSQRSIEAITRAVGFKFAFVPERREYAHTAAIVVLSPEGQISRYLYGVRYEPRDLRLAIVEAGEGKVGSTLDRILLYCFHYDATIGRYSAAAQNVMRLAGAATVLILGATLGLYWLAEINSKRLSRVGRT